MGEIVLYGNGCPKCNILKAKLEQSNIKFTEKDDVEKITSLGFNAYPVLQVDDEYMDFASAYRWINDRSSKNGN